LNVSNGCLFRLLIIYKIIERSNQLSGNESITKKEVFAEWTGRDINDYRIITLSDTSQWMLKFHNDENGLFIFFLPG